MHSVDFAIPFLAGHETLAATLHTGQKHLRPSVLALHGGGTSDRHGTVYLLKHLADHGISSIAFDFVGHGDSTGELIGSSLRDRYLQGEAVARALNLSSPSSLIGTSMGGHVACTLLDVLQPRNLILFCPAAYARDAQHLKFGPDFQQALRRTVDFSDSPAFTSLRQFEGSLLLVHGVDDETIPADVTQLYERSAPKATTINIIRLCSVGHKLHDYLRKPSDTADRVMREIVRIIVDGDRPAFS
jgi:fermentation-respiration switch protein FrsA (DUF1100 family)